MQCGPDASDNGLSLAQVRTRVPLPGDLGVLRSGHKNVDRSVLHPVYSVQRNTFGDTTLDVHLVSGDIVCEYAQSRPIF